MIQHYTYKQLLDIRVLDPENGWKPRNYATVTKRADSDIIVVRGSKDDHDVEIRPDDTIRYADGKVARVRRLDEIKDPLEKLLAQHKLPRSILAYDDSPVMFQSDFEYVQICGNAVYVELARQDWQGTDITFRAPVEVCGGDAVLVMFDDVKRGETVFRGRFASITVRKGADRVKVHRWLTYIINHRDQFASKPSVEEPDQTARENEEVETEVNDLVDTSAFEHCKNVDVRIIVNAVAS